MPKPLFGDNGSGMHTHQSLWNDETPLFYDENGYALLSEIGPLLHRRAAQARAGDAGLRRADDQLATAGWCPATRRRSTWCTRSATGRPASASRRTRTARRRAASSSARPDPSCNPYLTFAALLMAGLDGVQNKIEPPAPVDEDLYELEPEEAAKIQSAPGSLAEVLDALEADHDFLLKGDVFTADLIETWIAYKREREARRDRAAPASVRVPPVLRHLT